MAPDHPREWSSEPLAELADPNVPHSFIDGDWIESPYITDSGVRLIQTGNVGTGSFKDKSNRKFVSQDSFKELGCKYVMPGDLLFCRLADPIGRSCRAPTLDGPMLTSVDVTIMRPNPKRVVTDYLVQLSNSNRWLRRAAELAGGSTRSRISRSNLGKMTVPLPPLPEQRKIAEILGSVDEAIRATEAVIEQTRKVKEGLLQELLTKGIGHTKFKQTEIGEIPVGWEVVGVQDVADRERQTILTGPFGSSLSNSDFVGSGVPLLRIGNVQWGYLDTEDLLFVTEEKAKELERYRIRSGDLLFARQGATTGRNAMATDAVDGWLVNYHIIRVAFDHSRCLPAYLAFFFNSPTLQRQVDAEKGGGTREGINSSMIAGFRFALPPVDEQREICAVLGGCDDQISASRRQVSGLRRVKEGLLQDLLTGKVRVRV